MNVALDTNAYSDFLRGETSRVDIVRRATRIFLPLIVIGELRAGFAAETGRRLIRRVSGNSSPALG